MSFDERARRAADDLRRHVEGAVDAEDALASLPTSGRSRRPAGLALAAAAVAIVALVAGSLVLGGGGDGEEVTIDDRRRPATTVADLAPDVAVGAPHDGRDSMQLPVTVAPDTGLAPGDTVQVTGEGFNPGESVGIVMCTEDAYELGSDACDIGRFGTATPDADGRVEGTYEVRRLLSTPATGTVDCAAADVQCAIAVGQISDYDVSGGAPITFVDGLPPLQQPVLTVSPDRDLRHGDVVTLTGTGFEGQVWDGQICATDWEGVDVDPGAACWYLHLAGTEGEGITVDADGGFSMELPVWRAFPAYAAHGGMDVADCVAVACELSVYVSDGLTPEPVPLHFDPDGPLPQRPRITASPAEGLRPGDEVTVTVEGLEPGQAVAVTDCMIFEGGPEGGFCSMGMVAVDAVADGDGRVRVTIEAPSPAVMGVDCTRDGATCGFTVGAAWTEDGSGPPVLPGEPALVRYADNGSPGDRPSGGGVPTTVLDEGGATVPVPGTWSTETTTTTRPAR